LIGVLNQLTAEDIPNESPKEEIITTIQHSQNYEIDDIIEANFPKITTVEGGSSNAEIFATTQFGLTELSALLAETVNPHPAVIELANSSPLLLEYNEGALMDEKVQVRNMDAFTFLEDTDQWFDVIIVDLPDPNNESLNKLYTKEFYSLVRNHLKPGGAAMIQATSPVFAREVYWTISETVASTGLYVKNLHVDVPSFGNWGFVMASREEINLEDLEIDVETKIPNY